MIFNKTQLIESDFDKEVKQLLENNDKSETAQIVSTPLKQIESDVI